MSARIARIGDEAPRPYRASTAPLSPAAGSGTEFTMSIARIAPAMAKPEA
jgi:hypothetical protein